jgi:hypothetical protein
MSPTFLFTAKNNNGKNVTERVSAENLSAAKYKLEIQGYTEISFYDSELSNEVGNLFNERQKSAYKKVNPKQTAALQFKTGWQYTILRTLKVTAFYWIPMLVWAIYSKDVFPLIALIVFGVIMFHFIIPSIIFHVFINAHFWANNRKVRLWGRIAKLFNYVTWNGIPQFVIDEKLACADAREGSLNAGLLRLAKYENDSRVSKRIFKSSLITINLAAKNYDEVLKIRVNYLREGNIFHEDLIDYAVGMALHHKRTSEARDAINRALDMETTLLGQIYTSFCQGLIEVEDGNFANAEFYLQQSSKHLEPYRKNSDIVGIKYLVKIFLAITLGKQGDKEKSRILFQEAKPYLIAHKESELLQRCEEAVS